jgi:hypothetical protein
LHCGLASSRASSFAVVQADRVVSKITTKQEVWANLFID